MLLFVGDEIKCIQSELDIKENVCNRYANDVRFILNEIKSLENEHKSVFDRINDVKKEVSFENITIILNFNI